MGRKCGCGRRQRPTPTLPLPLAQPEPHILCTPTPKVYFTEKTKNKKRVNQTTSLSLGLREKQSMEESQSVRGRVCVYQGGLGEPLDEWTEHLLLTECTRLLLRCPEEYSHQVSMVGRIISLLYSAGACTGPRGFPRKGQLQKRSQ